MKPGTTVIQYGIQAQGREDKDVLGGIDRHQAGLGAGKDSGQMLRTKGLSGGEKLWAEPSSAKHSLEEEVRM